MCGLLTASSNGMSQDVSTLSQVKYISFLKIRDYYTVLNRKQQIQGPLMCDSEELFERPRVEQGP